MKPMTTIRSWQLDQLRKAMFAAEYMVQSTSQADATMYRDGGDGWTAVEVICHLRDFDKVYLERAQLTMNAAYPDLPFPPPRDLAAERNYNVQDLRAAFEEWKSVRAELIAYFEGIAEEDDWERAGRHPYEGHFSLNDQLLGVVWHDMNHLGQIGKILTEKKVSA